MNFVIPKKLEKEIDGVIGHYPEKRSASLMVLHALQDHFGYLSPESMEWTAAKLDLQPINIYELVTFYPMFRQKPVGEFHFKVCRTLSCALGGAQDLKDHLCRKLRLDSKTHGAQTTPDGRFTVEFVECLASCGTPPVMMCNDDFYEDVSLRRAEEILAKCRNANSK